MLGTLVLSLGLASCGSEDKGTLAFEIWGEDFIESGIPASEFVDGWSVSFETFLVALSDISAAQGSKEPDLSDTTQRVFDLTIKGPTPILTREVPAGRYDNSGYRIAPAGANAVPGNCSAQDLELLRSHAYSVYVKGSATKGSVTKHFAWGFTTDTTYHTCHSEADLQGGSAGTIQITIHADHLFYDDLFSSEPNVTFDVLAQADTDNDGTITEAEMRAFDIRSLPNYGTGSTGITNLWDFVGYLTHTLGHIDGEGHCETQAH